MGKTKIALIPSPDIEAKIPKARARLQASASKFVCVRKVGVAQRSVFAAMIARGEVEIFDSPLGRAYRLTSGECVERGEPRGQ